MAQPQARVWLSVAIPLLLATLPTQAPAAELKAEYRLQGPTLDGRPFDLSTRTGRVVMVVLWRTDCSVCLNKMPELRANALGWKAKPFDLVTLSVDPQRADTDRYDLARRTVASGAGPVWTFWQGDVRWPTAWVAGARLPVTLIFDQQGQLKARHEGRVPPDVWDDVAELLP
jgi:cytochrome oxidase Cu insertion factor (SCO1/SenC/PrrC family)